MSKLFISFHNVTITTAIFNTFPRLRFLVPRLPFVCCRSYRRIHCPRAQRRAPRTTEKFLLSCKFPIVLTSVSGDFVLSSHPFNIYIIPYNREKRKYFYIFFKKFLIDFFD